MILSKVVICALLLCLEIVHAKEAADISKDDTNIISQWFSKKKNFSLGSKFTHDPYTNVKEDESNIAQDAREVAKRSTMSGGRGSCGAGQIEVRYVVKTRRNNSTDSKKTSWNLYDLYTGAIVKAGINFVNGRLIYDQTVCVPDGAYKAVLHHQDVDGSIAMGGMYRLDINGETFKDISGPYWFHTLEDILCSVDSDCDDNNFCTRNACDITKKQCVSTPVLSRLCGIQGEFTALMLRVNADDVQTTPTKAMLETTVFDETDFSMLTQFADCSNNVFNIVPFKGYTTTNVLISRGVSELTIHKSIVGTDAGILADELFILAETLLGDLNSQFDFVLLCLPPGLEIGGSLGWTAYAFVDSFKSVYNDNNCLYPSFLMHEIGHNLGLAHSNDERVYGDETGMMGLSVTQIETPRKCYNGPKSWKLGWYTDSHIVVNVAELEVDEQINRYLVGIAGFQQRQENFATIVKLINMGDGYDYYITFNDARGINAETNEGVNKVMITRRDMGYFFGDSELVARLSDYQIYKLYGIDTGIELNIFTQIYLQWNTPFAVVWVRKESQIFCFNDKQCDDNNDCTIDTCDFDIDRLPGLCIYQERPCSECGSTVTVNVTTDFFPQHLTWYVENIDTMERVLSNEYYTENNTFYNSNECLQHGQYIFSLTNTNNDTMLDTYSSFSLSVGGIFLDGDNFTGEEFIDYLFVICRTDADCFDYNGCSVDFCDLDTNLCNSTLLNETEGECIDCSMFSIDIVTDNFPTETDWELTNVASGNTILFGEPYAYELLAAGRSKAPTRSGRSKAPTRAGRSKAPTRAGRSKAPTRVNRHLVVTPNVPDDDYDEDNIHEEYCLQWGFFYNFTITDFFGDGICCGSGLGSFQLSINDVDIQSGGEFLFSDTSVFQISHCNSDADCNDNNPCSIDTCRAQIGTCVYTTVPCADCGAVATIDIDTDDFPENIFWNITQNGRLFLSDSRLSTSLQRRRRITCLPYGSYSFDITDTYGDGLISCTKFGIDCGYKVSVDNEVVVMGMREAFRNRNHSFGICVTNADCDDNDDCTTDSCDTAKKTCKFIKNCEMCGKVPVEVTMMTDNKPNETSWRVKSIESFEDMVFTGGPYYEKASSFMYHECVNVGQFQFIISDSGNDGLMKCDAGTECGYTVKVNGLPTLSLNGHDVKQGNFSHRGQAQFFVAPTTSTDECSDKQHKDNCEKECKGENRKDTCISNCDFDFRECRHCFNNNKQIDFVHRRNCKRQCKGVWKRLRCYQDCDFDFSVCNRCHSRLHKKKCRRSCKNKNLRAACFRDCNFDFTQCPNWRDRNSRISG